MMANKPNGTIYTGVTSDLTRRVYEHKNDVVPGFTKKYGCKMLVYFEIHNTMKNAIEREKQIKSGARKKKLAMIEEMNPKWNDLYKQIV